MEKMSRSQFWIRLIIYVFFGAIIPLVFLTVRFNLFENVEKVSIGGWGIVAITFISVFSLKFLKKIKKGLPYSLLKQILDGVGKVILPLIIGCVCCYLLKDIIDYVFQFLFVLVFSESIAVIANPFPRWYHDNNIEQTNATVVDILSALGINKDKTK